MADYIERQKVLALGYCHCDHLDFDNPFPDWVNAVDTSDIEAMPAADVVEVVRCRDCKYHGYNNENEMYCYHCFGLDDVEPDYYCCHGERKE